MTGDAKRDAAKAAIDTAAELALKEYDSSPWRHDSDEFRVHLHLSCITHDAPDSTMDYPIYRFAAKHC